MFIRIIQKYNHLFISYFFNIEMEHCNHVYSRALPKLKLTKKNNLKNIYKTPLYIREPGL